MRFFLGWVFSVFALSAWAQFDKTAWPANTATPKIEAIDLQGKAWSTAELAGKVVVLNFWATWCAPCKDELPTLQTLHGPLHEGLATHC
jgi:thiol-disulfide isomerase/thioredoxin